MLAAVVCVLTLTIAGPVRTYFAQRTEMNQLAATEAALRRQIADLEQQKVKLADPAYIAAQARERLGFVKPGDIPYQVQLPPTAASPNEPGSQAVPTAANGPGTRRCGTRSPTRRTVRRHHPRRGRPTPAPRRRIRYRRWLIVPTWKRLRGSLAVSLAECSRSPIAAPTVSRAW
ncbi:septum formation initiator family protein [Mycobacterium xenopi 4042]|uniref:Septum formation initiator family protein n=1 Tax=Mycobacterium xenopi 4042 TaxID=1299334 RepID=X8AFY9_MYCXE|nr:septum formation initiator family protein [Mycobacterium xenopi 4042]